MKFIENKWHGINYLTYGKPENPAILFLHGNSCSGAMFKDQFQSLFNNYYLIAPDLLGHGNSDKAENVDDYSIQNLGKPILGLINYLGLEEVLIYGVSLGGHVAIELIPYLKKSLKGIMISGTPPFKSPLNLADCFSDNPTMQNAFKEVLMDIEIQDLVDACMYNNKEAKESLKKWITQTDPEFRSNFGASLASGSGLGNQWQIIENTEVPVSLLKGEFENLINNEYVSNLNPKILFKKNVNVISNSLHFPSVENPKEFNLLLKEFADDSFSR